MFVKPEGRLQDMKTAIFHHLVKAKHLNFSTYIHIFYYQSSICLLDPKTVANLPDM